MSLYGILTIDETSIEAYICDGYTNITQLCNTSNKQYSNWIRLTSAKEYIQLLSIELDIPEEKLIVYRPGSNNERATFAHPRIAIHIAYWINKNFASKVSKWIYELIATGQVTLNEEKTNEEIELLRRRINSAEQQAEFAQMEYDKLMLKHNHLKKHKVLYKLKQGSCFYIISDKTTPRRFKVGQCGNINTRLANHRTTMTYLTLHLVMYTPKADAVENMILIEYEDSLKPTNHEILDIDFEQLHNSVKIIQNQIKKFTLLSDEDLEEYNKTAEYGYEKDYGDTKEEDEEKKDEPPTHKRCPGFTHDKEKDRILPLSAFSKNKTNNDGYQRLCKECVMTKKSGADRNRKKVIEVPTVDHETQKFCMRCEKVKLRTEFNKDSLKADGLNSCCRDCKRDMKKKSAEVQKKIKGIEKVCARCDKSLPSECFKIDTRNKDGMQAWCKKCASV